MAIPINSEEVLTPPVPSATVMVLRDGETGLEVLMVRRHGASGVLGGVHVFPGGKLDPEDTRAEAAALGCSPQALHAALGEAALDEAMALGLFVAAQRETREEVGLVLALHTLVPWSRWITPRVPSVTNKRFDTRFFAALMPEGQTAEHDNHEATEAVWLAPREGLARYWDGEIELAPPQIMTLAELTRFERAADALAFATRRAPPLIEPHPMDVEGRRVICYPGDPAHPVQRAVWVGPTRLTHRNRRFEPEGGLEALFNSA